MGCTSHKQGGAPVNNKRKFGLGLAAVAVTMILAACEIRVGLTQLACQDPGQNAGCRTVRIKSHTSDGSPFGNSLDQFNASYARVDLSASNVSFPSQTGYVTLKLLNGSTVIATKSFPWYKSGSYLKFSSPSAVTSWVQANGGSANTFDISFDEIKYNYKTGENTVVVEYYYNTTKHAGSSWSGYLNDGGGDGPPTHEQ